MSSDEGASDVNHNDKKRKWDDCLAEPDTYIDEAAKLGCQFILLGDFLTGTDIELSARVRLLAEGRVVTFADGLKPFRYLPNDVFWYKRDGSGFIVSAWLDDDEISVKHLSWLKIAYTCRLAGAQIVVVGPNNSVFFFVSGHEVQGSYLYVAREGREFGTVCNPGILQQVCGRVRALALNNVEQWSLILNDTNALVTAMTRSEEPGATYEYEPLRQVLTPEATLADCFTLSSSGALKGTASRWLNTYGGILATGLKVEELLEMAGKLGSVSRLQFLAGSSRLAGPHFSLHGHTDSESDKTELCRVELSKLGDEELVAISMKPYSLHQLRGFAQTDPLVFKVSSGTIWRMNTTGKKVNLTKKQVDTVPAKFLKRLHALIKPATALETPRHVPTVPTATKESLEALQANLTFF